MTTLTTLRKLKADAGHMLPIYNSAKHADSELYRFASGNVERSTLTEHEKSEDEVEEAHSAECISEKFKCRSEIVEVDG